MHVCEVNKNIIMKLNKKITINEAIAKLSDTTQPTVGVVFADAVRQSTETKEKIAKTFDEQKNELPNEDRFAHKKVAATKEMKKMKLAESLFTEWFDDDKEKETFVQPNIILEEGQYKFDEESGNITVNKAIFDDYMEGKKLNVKFVDEEGEDIFCYKMISETDDSITMEYVGEGIPGIDEEVAECQKYPIEKPEAKDSEFISAGDKQPKDLEKAKDSQFISAKDKQPEKAAMKESKLSNWDKYDKTIDRIKTTFAHKDWSKIEKGIEKSDAGKEQIIKALRANGYFNYAKMLDAFNVYLTGDPEVIGYLVPTEFKIVLNRELDIDTVVKVVKHELDHQIEGNGLKESFTNWDSPESRIERYETDLPELMATMHDLYMNGRVEAQEYAEALKVAYDALDSVPSMDEALEDSQRYPIEKPKAKDSQFISAKDKQPTIGDAKDSQFISAGDKDVEKAFGERKLGESVEPLNEEVVYKYKPTRDPVAEIIQVELTEGEWGYREENGKQTPTRLPSANYMPSKIGASWDRNDKYAITVLGANPE